MTFCYLFSLASVCLSVYFELLMRHTIFKWCSYIFGWIQDEVDECARFPCQHGGTCTDKVNDYLCNCTDGWTGKNCESPIDFCRTTDRKCQSGDCFNLIDDKYCRWVIPYQHLMKRDQDLLDANARTCIIKLQILNIHQSLGEC